MSYKIQVEHEALWYTGFIWMYKHGTFVRGSFILMPRFEKVPRYLNVQESLRGSIVNCKEQLLPLFSLTIYILPGLPTLQTYIINCLICFWHAYISAWTCMKYLPLVVKQSINQSSDIYMAYWTSVSGMRKM